ncbi:hypothetical protein [Loigolactobacillus coryniformis]|uniref:hypothetical protein n=1 Tax=Loigolactobacillus coryniformis TaxID=1610 RepID=UPI00215CCC41|nr:hypothetical protein [Loigolactobacillus coryniformis]
MALGNNGFNVIGALFLSQFRLGFIVFGIFTFAGVLIATLIVHEPSNLDETSTKKKEKFSLKNVKLIFLLGKLARLLPSSYRKNVSGSWKLCNYRIHFIYNDRLSSSW